MAPEYALEGQFSVKSDAFSFGVVVLEIVSGKKNTGFFDPQLALSLLGYVRKTLNLFLKKFDYFCDSFVCSLIRNYASDLELMERREAVGFTG